MESQPWNLEKRFEYADSNIPYQITMNWSYGTVDAGFTRTPSVRRPCPKTQWYIPAATVATNRTVRIFVGFLSFSFHLH